MQKNIYIHTLDTSSSFHLVRVTNLRHKNGQAGVTKATVSITFDNMDKKQSPLGYEQYDEITITRQVRNIKI